MKRILIVIIILIAGIVSAQTSVEVAKKGIKSTVSVIAMDKYMQPLASGSGFIIGEELVVTNVHVIAGCSSVQVVKNGDEKKFKVTGYVAIDKENDLVILKVIGLNGQKLTLESGKEPEIGEKVFAVGNPKGFNGTFSEGLISGFRKMGANDVIQITAPISPGSSGGAILNTAGDVIGIAFASFNEGQNLNFAIPVKYLVKLQSNIGDLNNFTNTPATIKSKNSPVFKDVKEGVEVRNVKGCTTCFPNMIFFSLKNNLNVTISDVRILFIVYDSKGEVIDYVEATFFKRRGNNFGIKPLLAKTVSFDSDEAAPNVTLPSVYKIKSRILDFNISEE